MHDCSCTSCSGFCSSPLPGQIPETLGLIQSEIWKKESFFLQGWRDSRSTEPSRVKVNFYSDYNSCLFYVSVIFGHVKWFWGVFPSTATAFSVSVQSVSSSAERTAANQTAFSRLTDGRMNSIVFVSAPRGEINSVCVYWFTDFYFLARRGEEQSVEQTFIKRNMWGIYQKLTGSWRWLEKLNVCKCI